MSLATCFLFTHSFEEENYLSLRLNADGEVDASLERRTLDELKALQMNAKTCVVLPTEMSGLHALELPKLSDRKARAAIPYALEEQVAQQVSTLHFAFDTYQDEHHHYLVSVTDKALLVNLMTRLQAAHLLFDKITLDWFALSANEACVTETSLLINDATFKGALSLELAGVYLHSRSKDTQVHLFNDSPPIQGISSCNQIDSTSYVWIAKRLLIKPSVLNLCQGELQHDARPNFGVRWYQASALLAGVWLLSLLAVNAFTAYQLTNQITELEKKIAAIYHEFFPQSQQVISPQFRVTQLLKEGAANRDTVLWTLLNKLALSAKNTALTIQQIRFQNQSLSITVATQDFAALEALQQRLQQNNVQVHQTEAATHEQQVFATLELRL
jgi:general secretion pathway protein L